MKILILCPNPINKGGITNYFQTITKYFSIRYRLHYRSGLGFKKNKFISLVAILKSYFIFIFISPFYNIIHFNTSLNRQSLIRDLFFLFYSKLFNKKIIFFIRGWDEDYSKSLSENKSKIISIYINNSNTVIVLSNSFKESLIKWGCQKDKIVVETTIVDDEIIQLVEKDDSEKIIKLLFLARVEKDKGIYEVLEAFKILQKEYNVNLIIAGYGDELLNVKKKVKEDNIKNVKFVGFVKLIDKCNVFNISNIYIFPSFHNEGMPNSVLEAMAFGLPIITRPVGGLVDFFENEKMGYITSSRKSEEYARLIENLILNPQLRIAMGNYNKIFADKYFIASKVAKRIEAIYHNVMLDKNKEYFWKNN